MIMPHRVLGQPALEHGARGQVQTRGLGPRAQGRQQRLRRPLGRTCAGAEQREVPGQIREAHEGDVLGKLPALRGRTAVGQRIHGAEHGAARDGEGRRGGEDEDALEEQRGNRGGREQLPEKRASAAAKKPRRHLLFPGCRGPAAAPTITAARKHGPHSKADARQRTEHRESKHQQRKHRKSNGGRPGPQPHHCPKDVGRDARGVACAGREETQRVFKASARSQVQHRLSPRSICRQPRWRPNR
mmetsp:Transcript_19967/g.69303  ORF Transcript_19967/g.69303 Transcript_19967/m.69303 type:complete len:244 (-) Transcript_19967:103-834(-)